MRDIKDYFVSPQKQTKKIEEDEIPKVEKDSNLEPNEIQEVNNDQNKRIEKRKYKRKKKRKHSDPEVRTVTQLLSESLQIVSPCTTPDSKNVSIEVVLTRTESALNLSDNNKEESLKENKSENKPTKNAFEFMMERRNHSIGLNSPGKELDIEKSNSDLNKEKLTARRQVFSDWSDKKISLKGKLSETERDEIIDHKLKIRAKRFKKILGVVPTEKSVRKKRDKKINSDDSCSDFEQEMKRSVRKVKKSKGQNIESNVIVKRKRVKKIVSSGSDSDIELLEKEIKRSVKKIKTINEEPIKTAEEEVKHNKSISNSQNKEMLQVENDSSSSRLILKLDNLTDKSGNKLIKNVQEITDQDDSLKVITEEVIENHDLVNNLDTVECPEETKVNKEKKHKHKKNKKNKSKAIHDTVNVTPRTLRSWNMKIKINVGDDSDTETRTRKTIDYAEIDLCDDSEEDEKPDLKVAPVFIKSKPKPKEDQAVVEARKKFLMGGIPSSLKKTIEKQKSLISKPSDIFPKIQHIQQKCDNPLWNLTKPDLKLSSWESPSVDFPKCEKITKKHLNKKLNIDTETKKVGALKILLNKIKSENPNYPVYRSFRQLQAKSGKQIDDNTTSSKKRKRKKHKKTDEIKTKETDCVMWTEKYKPNCSDDIIGNAQAVRSLKKWLECWKNFSQEINSRNKRCNSSESEFETTDCDSKDSTNLPEKLIVLEGPCGCGKSTAVYAICNELEFKVIELNASSKRTGKRLLQEIQEATQSHQIHRREAQALQNFFNSNSKTEKSESLEPTNKKMCVVLIEDVDIVFEQDDGFMSALIQLATTSKRPIICTTTDSTSIYVQKFLNQYDFLTFSPLSSYSLSTWFQILILCEDLYVSREEIVTLLEYNNGDARKTMLQLQFWVQSGGELQNLQNDNRSKIQHKRYSSEIELVEDDQCDELSLNKNIDCEVFEHRNCMKSFEIFEGELNEPFVVPINLNLGLLWWNIPNLLNLTKFSKQRITKIIKDDNDEDETVKKAQKDKLDKNRLSSIIRVYDSLLTADVMFNKTKYHNNFEPIIGQKSVCMDSLESNEIFEERNYNQEFMLEITHSLINGSIRNCTESLEETALNFAVPDKDEKKWKAKLHKYEKIYQDPLPLTIDRKSVALDYMSTLRNIERLESSRAATNTKRGNRFRNYLKNVGINSNEDNRYIACKILCDDFIL